MRLSFVCIVLLLTGATWTSSHAASEGGLVAFTSTRDGPDSLYVVRPDGTQLRRMVAGADDPRISPDGRHVIFNPAASAGMRLIDLSTGRIRHVPQAGEGSANTQRPWSNDSKHVAEGSPNGGIWVYNADGTGGRRLTSGFDADPAWSPDDKLIAFDSGEDVSGVYVIHADGTGLRRLHDGEAPEWSPDGKEIAFTENETTYVIPSAGGRPTRIAPGVPAWSPDGKLVAVANEDVNGLALYRPDGTRVRVLLRGNGGADTPSWSPDGRQVLAAVGNDLWLYASSGSSARRVIAAAATHGYLNYDPTWSRAAPARLAGTLVAATSPSSGPLIALSSTTGRPVPGFPQVSGRPSAPFDNASEVDAIVDDGAGGWYVGGDFDAAGGVSCANLVHITARRSVDPHWCPHPNGVVRALVRLGSTLYVGGDRMTRTAGDVRDGLAAFDTRTGRLTAWNPRVGGSVYGLRADPSGRTIVFFGAFGRVHGAVRSNLAAVDAGTGRATSFAPNPDTNFHGDGVAAIAVTATRIYSAGYYEHIGGHVARDSPVALDPRTGHVIAWQPQLPGLVNSFASAGDRVYVAGSFQRLAGIPRNNLGAFAGATGAVYSWNPALSSGQEVYQVALSGARIFAALAGRVIALDTTSARAVWQTRMRFSGGGVNALAAAGGLVLAGGNFRDAQRVAG